MPINQVAGDPILADRGAQTAGARHGESDPAAKKVAREFEAMFIALMLKSMRSTAGGESATGGGRAEDTYRSLLDQEYAMAAAQGGGIGLARSIERELARGCGVERKGVRCAHED